ncbi:CUB domain-containing protein [Aphis craccivora]|uniref:CUB domain-containing protein n=1 Tax=Aphis craccivora TaxID=307492 RepID=A0A6G0YKJ6_APHCR|nr:CUB domain-containing protein [Aphis craccivora]
MTTCAAAVISWLMVTLLINWTVVMPTLSCRISEFMCKSTGGCIQLDEYCDGKYDCPDRSDEPPSCTACNRTYYGEVGKSYRLSVKKIQKERPFLCHLSFTASGQEHGDFVEVRTLESIIVSLVLRICRAVKLYKIEYKLKTQNKIINNY